MIIYKIISYRRFYETRNKIFYPSGQLAAVANGLDNSITVYKVDKSTGQFSFLQVVSLKAPNGWSTPTLTFSPNGKFAAVSCDPVNSTGFIVVYSINTTGKFSEIQRIQHSPNDGYNIIAFSPSGKLAAVTNALASPQPTITVFPVDPNTGQFNQIQNFQAGFGLWAIAFSPKDNIAAATFQDSVSVYAVNPGTGTFNLIQNVNTLGLQSMDVTFSPNGKFAAVANYNNNTLSIYKINTIS